MKCWFLFAVWLLVSPIYSQVFSTSTPVETTENQTFTVVVMDVELFQSWAARQQIILLGGFRPANIVALEATTSFFNEKIASNPLVLFAMPASVDPKEELPVPGHNIFVNKINVAQARFPAFNGAGTTISIREFRFDSTDVDFQNRVLTSPSASTDLTTHASIMATLVGGAGNSDPAGRGVAPGCRLQSAGYGLLLPAEDYAARSVTVENHSYGVEVENFYGTNALAYDVSALENPKLLHVFSAGNKGTGSASSGIYANVPGFANLTGNFKMAKNVLTVGAVDSMGAIAFFSSRGPAYDGRIKPDLAAFGQDGSSGSAALVSGSAAVLQQIFVEQFDSLPASDLLRAVLINSADDLGHPGPDYAYGFGSLNLKNALQTVLNRQFITAQVAAGESIAYPVSIPSNARQLKVTLTWNDPPAPAGAPAALVNDLDLLVSGPAGQTWLPWVLHAAPQADSLRLPAIRARDTRNNVEQITVDIAVPGAYEIQVFGPQTGSASQPFSITYAWDTLAHFEWTYPIRHDPALAAHDVILEWETNVTNMPGRLEWKPAGDNIWRLIDSAVALQSGFYRWFLPEVFTEAQVRMQLPAQVVTSDTFLISGELRLKVAFNCPDSVGLYWNRAAVDAGYQLFGLGDRYLEPLFVTGDTFVVLAKNQFQQQRFAVSPLGAFQAALGRRSAGPDIGQQGITCYQQHFFAELTAEQSVDITLLLSATYGVTQVVFEKWDGIQFYTLQTITPVENPLMSYVDVQPDQGKNTYRAVIFTTNGGMLQSDTVSVYVTGQKKWLVFPNPVFSGNTLQVLSFGSGEADFNLYDALGRLVLTKKLDDYRVELTLPELPAGIYFFVAMENGKRLWSGGVVVKH